MGCLSAARDCPWPCACMLTPQPDWGDAQCCVGFVGMHSTPRMSAAVTLGLWRGLHTSLDASNGCTHPQTPDGVARILRRQLWLHLSSDASLGCTILGHQLWSVWGVRTHGGACG